MELWKPLLTMATLVEKSGRKGLVKEVTAFARESASEARRYSLDPTDTALLEALAKSAGVVKQPLFSKDIIKKMKPLMEEGEAMPTGKAIGETLRKFGLAGDSQMINGRHRWRISKAQVEKVRKAYLDQ
jgi:hypothetical protein